VPGARIDEAAVVIAVRGGKASGAAAAFDRQQDDGVLALGNPAESFVDGGNDRGIEARAERAQPAQIFRSTIVLLMLAMASAGLRCLGQALAQFMIV
jgi:hypothetical protein